MRAVMLNIHENLRLTEEEKKNKQKKGGWGGDQRETLQDGRAIPGDVSQRKRRRGFWISSCKDKNPCLFCSADIFFFWRESS